MSYRSPGARARSASGPPPRPQSSRAREPPADEVAHEVLLADVEMPRCHSSPTCVRAGKITSRGRLEPNEAGDHRARRARRTGRRRGPATDDPRRPEGPPRTALRSAMRAASAADSPASSARCMPVTRSASSDGRGGSRRPTVRPPSPSRCSHARGTYGLTPTRRANSPIRSDPRQRHPSTIPTFHELDKPRFRPLLRPVDQSLYKEAAGYDWGHDATAHPRHRSRAAAAATRPKGHHHEHIADMLTLLIVAIAATAIGLRLTGHGRSRQQHRRDGRAAGSSRRSPRCCRHRVYRHADLSGTSALSAPPTRRSRRCQRRRSTPSPRPRQAQVRAALPRRARPCQAADVVKLTSAKTAEGRSVTIKVVDGSVFVDRAKVTTPT